MNADERDRRADEWLDAALARYSRAEPRAGLEQRILANLEARQRTRIPWWGMAWAAAAAVLVISAGLLWMSRHRAQPAPAPAVQAQSAPPQAKSPAAPRSPQASLSPRISPVRVRPARAAVSASQPRREVFPSPAPLTAQELAAIRLARRDPNVVQTIVQMQELERRRMERLLEEPAPPR